MSIFTSEQFKLCNVPVPHGYPQSQTHCSIIYVDDTFIMSTSPYPSLNTPRWRVYMLAILKKLCFGLYNPFYIGENYENPCLYISEYSNGCNIPIKFNLLGGSPVMGTPIDKYGLGSYCSDPNLTYDDDVFYLLNRTTFRKARTGNVDVDYETYVHLIAGNIKSKRFVIDKQKILFSENDVSPCLAKYNGRYIYTSLRTTSYNSGLPCEGLYIREAIDPFGKWSDKKIIQIDKGNYEPWHMSLFEYDGILYSIIACVHHGEKQRCWQMLGEFDKELRRIKIYQTPLTSYKSYRGAAIVTKDGEFILYNTTVNEKIKGGQSVDGREIIMSHAPFKDIIDQLRNDDKNISYE